MNSLSFEKAAVSIVANQRRRLVGINLQLSKLKRLGGNALLATLRKGDSVNEPIGSGGVRDMLCPLREKHVPRQPVPIPVFASGEMLAWIGR